MQRPDIGEAELKRAGARLRTCIEMFDAGVAMKRAQLVRQNPEASVEEIAVMLRTWLHTRPGAEHGDCVGTPRELSAVSPGR